MSTDVSRSGECTAVPIETDSRFTSRRSFPKVSIIRPTETTGAATGAFTFLTDGGLFRGQSHAFFKFMKQLAEAADAAMP
jgi:hypothetical protein